MVIAVTRGPGTELVAQHLRIRGTWVVHQAYHLAQLAAESSALLRAIEVCARRCARLRGSSSHRLLAPPHADVERTCDL